MRFFFTPLLLLACMAVDGQNTNVEFNAKLVFSNQRLANVWGYADGGQEYALVGAQLGLIIVDVTDPYNPQQIVQIPGTNNGWREIKTYSHYAYVVSEAYDSKILVVDLSTLPDPNPTYHTVDGGSGFSKSHALHIDEVKGYLYVYGSNLYSGKPLIFNLNTDPYNPSYVGYVNFIDYVHDGYVNNDMMYSAHIYQGLVAAINVSNKSNPILLGTVSTPNTFPHNTWLSGNTMFTTDEVSNSYLTSYDISDPTNMEELDRIQITPGSYSIVHNTHVINDYAVTSWYTDGFAIIDVARPANMVQVGRYDTYPNGSGNGFEGCWGVYPYLPSGTILASNRWAQNTNNGELFVCTPAYVRGCYFEGTVTDANTGFPLNGTSVQIISTSTSGTTNPIGQYKIGQLEDGSFIARFSRIGYIAQDHTISLDNGVLTLLDVALVPVPPLPVEWTRFEARLEGKDALLNWETASEHNNAGFQVQHSTNEGRDWQNMGLVLPQGDGTAPAAYKFRIPGLSPGIHFFRLRQTDLDGESSFSPIRSLKVYGDCLTLDLWPNPAQDYSQLRIRTGRAMRVQIEVLNMNQQPVGISFQQDVDAETLVPIELGQLPAGVYTLRVWDEREQEQVVLIKK